MKRLVTTDKQRNRTAVPAPKGFANLVTDKLQERVDAEDINLFTPLLVDTGTICVTHKEEHQQSK